MKTISELTAHKVFRYGTHEQLENSINRWLKNGVAVQTHNKYYEPNLPNDLTEPKELEINVRGKYGTPVWKAHALVAKQSDGLMTLLDARV